MSQKNYLTIRQACELLSVSRPTFNKIRKQGRFKEFLVGKRVRFLREEIEKIADPKPVAAIPPDQRTDLSIWGRGQVSDIEVEPNTFDLRKIRHFDPHGVLDLFCTVLDRAQHGATVKLIVVDNFICDHLRNLGFFVELEKSAGERVQWERDSLRTDYTDVRYPIGLTDISLQKQEAPVIDHLIQLLRQQGFSEAIGGYIGWIYGELVDNATTHLMHSGTLSSNPDCYLLAQRFRFPKSDSECLIIGVADVGPGIHATLKRNPKYSALGDAEAFLTSFKPNVSSWGDEYKRGKGLTDILSIAMGNGAILRAESGGHIFFADFRNTKKEVRFDSKRPNGTRFSLVVIDHKFEVKSRKEVEEYVDSVLAGL